MKAYVKDVMLGIHPGRRKTSRPRRRYNINDIKQWKNETISEAARKTKNREQMRTMVVLLRGRRTVIYDSEDTANVNVNCNF